MKNLNTRTTHPAKMRDIEIVARLLTCAPSDAAGLIDKYGGLSGLLHLTPGEEGRASQYAYRLSLAVEYARRVESAAQKGC